MNISDDDAAGLALVMAKVAALQGFDCHAYKPTCLKRRVAVRMRARGTPTYAAYVDVLNSDPDEFDRLLKTLTINVSRFYRNPETWQKLVGQYLPDLWERRGGAVRCWSAGCAAGEEPYTLALVLTDLARQSGWVGPLLARVEASDIDQDCLAIAKEAVYRDAAFEDLPDTLKVKYLERSAPDRSRVVTEVRDLVRFHRHDLTRAAAPEGSFDLVMCRNAIIYFDRATQERLFARIADHMEPGGLLVLGKVETLLGVSATRFELVDLRERIYRKL